MPNSHTTSSSTVIATVAFKVGEQANFHQKPTATSYPKNAPFSTISGSKAPLYAVIFICIALVVVVALLPTLHGFGSYSIQAPKSRCDKDAFGKNGNNKDDADSFASGSSNARSNQAAGGIKKRGAGNQHGFQNSPYEPSQQQNYNNSQAQDEDYNDGYVYRPAGEVQVDDEDEGSYGPGNSKDIRSKVSNYLKAIPKNSYVKSVSSATAKTASAAASVVPTITFESNVVDSNKIPKKMNTPSSSSGAGSGAAVATAGGATDASKAYNTNIDNDFDYDAFIEEQEKEDKQFDAEDKKEQEAEQQKLKENRADLEEIV